MKRKIYTQLFRPLLLLTCFWASMTTVRAQEPRISTEIQRGLERKAREKFQEGKEGLRDQIREKKEELKDEAKDKVRETKRELPNQIGDAAKERIKDNPKLDELIEDEETRAAIENAENRRRFVRLFGEWWGLPSQADLDALRELRRKAAVKIDSSKYMYPKKVKGTDQDVIVFGWYPAYAEMGDIYKNYKLKRLTALSYYSYDVDPNTGLALNPDVVDKFLTGDFVKTLHSNERRALLSVSLHGEKPMRDFLAWENEAARRTLIDSLLMILDSTKADGIEVNFMDVSLDQQDDFMKFMKDLSASVRSIVLDSANMERRFLILLSVPPYDPYNVYDLSRLEPYFDYAIVMAFNFQQTPDGLEFMPTSPFNYNPVDQSYDIRASVEKYLTNLGRYRSNRMILGLPFFGTQWTSQGDNFEFVDNLPYNTIRNRYKADSLMGSTIRLDSSKTCVVWEYVDTTGKARGQTPITMTIFYDDVWSLERKYKYVNDMRLGGVGFWFIGYDFGFSEMGELIDREFMTFVPPVNEKLEKLKEGSSVARRYGTILLAVLLYWAIFMACGFCYAMVEVRTRQALFDNGRFRLVYLSGFTLLLLIIGANLGLFEGPAATLMLGVLFGAFVAWLALKLVQEKQAKQP